MNRLVDTLGTLLELTSLQQQNDLTKLLRPSNLLITQDANPLDNSSQLGPFRMAALVRVLLRSV